MYNTTATGLSPEIAHFNMNPDVGHDIEIHSRDTHNILRPETIESLFYLHRATGDRVYQEWGWQIFSAFEKHSKIETGGYSGLQNVQVGWLNATE
jgi:mannosyl-oligosaccharide alpha-1,2-mannosidase